MATTKIFVGSLPPGTKPEELRHLFESYGVVTECDIMNRCGFVHMETLDMADDAIKALHDTQFKGQNIVVEAGRPKDRKKSSQGGQPTGRGGNREMAGSRGGRRGSGPMGGRGNGRGGMLVGFSGSMSGSLKEAATMELAGAIMQMLNENSTSSGGARQGGPPRSRGGSFGGSSGGGRGVQRLERNNDIGPIRNDNTRGQQRNVPYTRGGGGGGKFGADKYGTGSQSVNKYGGAKFGGGSGGGFSGGFGGGFNSEGFGSSDSYDNWQTKVPEHSRGGRGFNENKGFGNVGFSGGNQTQMAVSSMGNQDRRGFALPGGGQQHFGEGDRSRFGAASDNVAESPMFSRRNNPPNIAGSAGGRGGFGNTPRGVGRGGYGGGRGGSGSVRSSFRGGRGGSNRGGVAGPGNNRNISNHGINFNEEFPPLNAGFNRNTPRDMMSNRRY